MKQKKKKRNKEIRGKKEINDILIKDRIIKDIRRLFEQENDDDYFKLKIVRNFWNNNYIEYESNSDRNKSLDEYLNKIEPYLTNVIIDLN